MYVCMYAVYGSVRGLYVAIVVGGGVVVVVVVMVLALGVKEICKLMWL